MVIYKELRCYNYGESKHEVELESKKFAHEIDNYLE